MPTFAYILYDILLSLLAVRWLNVGQLLEIKLWCCHLTFSHIFKSNMKSCYTKETWKKIRWRLMCVMCIGNHLYKVFFQEAQLYICCEGGDVHQFHLGIQYSTANRGGRGWVSQIFVRGWRVLSPLSLIYFLSLLLTTS